MPPALPLGTTRKAALVPPPPRKSRTPMETPASSALSHGFARFPESLDRLNLRPSRHHAFFCPVRRYGSRRSLRLYRARASNDLIAGSERPMISAISAYPIPSTCSEEPPSSDPPPTPQAPPSPPPTAPPSSSGPTPSHPGSEPAPPASSPGSDSTPSLQSPTPSPGSDPDSGCGSAPGYARS